MKIISIVGEGRNSMRVIPLMEAYRRLPDVEPTMVHTGQRYDPDW